jgi:predicted ferric reductase
MYSQLFHRSRVGLMIIIAILGLIVGGWLQALPLVDRLYNFQEILRSIGQLAALLGFGMIAINLILSGRFKRLERYFGGVDKMYVLHHIIGGIGFILVLLHPLFIAGAYYLDSPIAASKILWFGPSLYKNMGNVSLLLFIALIVLTLFVKLPYELWHKTHKLMGIAFLLGGIHAVFTGSSIAASPFLKTLLLTLAIVALGVYAYRTIFGRWLVSRYRYRVESITKLNDQVTQIVLSTKGERLRFVPGQFAFFTFSLPNGKKETHPFTISSKSQVAQLTITAKSLGDFTSNISQLKPGSVVWVEGPFGTFLSNTSSKQIWIAGGIGVTPFASRIFSGLEEYEHIDFFYTASKSKELVYAKEFETISTKHKQLKLHLHSSQEKGRLTAKEIKKQVNSMTDRIVYLCGPLPMMLSLQQQLIEAGTPEDHLFIEQFSIT